MRTERHILVQSWKLIVADRVCSWRSFFWTFFWDLNLFGLVLQHPTAQDTGGAIAHPLARRLSNVSGKNNARDWWRSFKDGPDSQIACVLDSFFCICHISSLGAFCITPWYHFFRTCEPLVIFDFTFDPLAFSPVFTSYGMVFLGGKISRSEFWTFSHLTKIRKCNRSGFLWSTKI